MIGEKRSGLFRIIRGTKVQFFIVRPNSEGTMVIIRIEHIDGSSREIKESEVPLTDQMWKKLSFWQGTMGSSRSSVF
jgi:hypothetical protein